VLKKKFISCNDYAGYTILASSMASLVQLLNTHKPSVKCGLQFFQLMACHVGIFCIVKKRLYSKENDDAVGPIGRVAYGAALISFICTAATTPFVASKIARVSRTLFSDAFLLKWLGKNGTFAENWKHPRHVVSLAGAILAIPAAIRCFVGAAPMSRYHRGLHYTALVSLIAGRPGLHLLNAVAQRIFVRRSL